MNTTSTKLMGVETANPDSRWTQEEICKSVEKNGRISPKAKVFYKRFLGDKGIHARHFGVENLDQMNEESPDQANERFARVATRIGADAVRKCLERLSVDVAEVDALIVTTCTGYLCPGLTSYISEAIGCKDSIYALDLAGLGCGAAIPALRSGHEYLRAHPDSRVVVLSVEVCSAALSWGDEIDLILSNSIFSDGAAACILSNRKADRGLEIVAFESLLWPKYRDHLRFRTRDSRLCNEIHKNVPEVASAAVKYLHDKFLRQIEGGISHYGVHPGGRRILDEIECVLKLGGKALTRSREVLREYGNMSSPSILYVLKKIVENDPMQRGDHLALFSFGAGFTAFGVVFKSA